MALVSMATGDDYRNEIGNDTNRDYGYGTQVFLNQAQCKALGIKEPLRAGTRLGINAVVFVMSSTERSDGDKDGDDESAFEVGLQITDLELKGVAQGDAAGSLYGGE